MVKDHGEQVLKKARATMAKMPKVKNAQETNKAVEFNLRYSRLKKQRQNYIQPANKPNFNEQERIK